MMSLLSRPCNAIIGDDCVIMKLDSKGVITIGEDTRIEGQLLTLWNGGHIEIGSNCFVGPNTRLWSQSSIKVGNHVLISHTVDIHDTNSHPLDSVERRKDAEGILITDKYLLPTQTQSAPIVIEDDAWICMKSSIMKGVTVGKGAVVAANSVVTKNVDPYTIVAGTPATMIGTTT